jgi:uncharacterized protein
VPALAVSTAYAAFLALLYVGLSSRVIRRRRAAQVAIGTGGLPELERAARVHANFAEYAPIGLLLLLLLEAGGAPAAALHAAGIALTAGRVVHAYGVSREAEDFRFRVAGMALTLTTIAVLAVALLLRAIV